MRSRIVNLKKALFIFFIILTLVELTTICTRAECVTDIEKDILTNRTRSLLDEIDVVSDKNYVRQRSSHLDYGYVQLRKISPTRAGILGTTQAFHECPELHLNIYVDKYDDTTKEWKQWRYWEYSALNADHLTKSMEIIVPSGHFYSVRGYHICVHGTAMETIDTITDGLYIGITNEPVE